MKTDKALIHKVSWLFCSPFNAIKSLNFSNMGSNIEQIS
nr:MAG TPA: hypothetical protein [Caudoviricetes sp.]